MQQDKMHQLTLQNEVKGLDQQTKSVSEIYWEGEEAQKQQALYVKILKRICEKQRKHLEQSA